MGSSTFLQFNPTQANQETDAEYLADATRLDGALNGNAWQADSANKTLYQVSTMVSALAQMMANKGFTMQDANYASLVAQLANILTSVDLRVGLQNLAWSSTITLTVNKFLGFAIALTSSAALAVTGPTAGDMVVVLYTQGSAGGSVVTFPGNFYGASQPDPTPNVTSGQIFMVDATLNFWAVGALISPTGINNTPIGAAAPASGNFSTLTCPTRTPGDSTTNAATTAFVTAATSVTSQNNVIGARSLSTVYHNTTGRPLLVQVGMSAGASGQVGVNWWLTGFSGTTSGSLITVGQNGVTNAATGYCGVSFVVPSGYYYELAYNSDASISPTPQLNYWVEVQL